MTNQTTSVVRTRAGRPFQFRSLWLVLAIAGSLFLLFVSHDRAAAGVIAWTKLTVVKQAWQPNGIDPYPGPWSFDFTCSGVNIGNNPLNCAPTFALTDSAASYYVELRDAKALTLTETGPPGWNVSVSCVNYFNTVIASGTNSVTLNITTITTERVTCTFTNVPQSGVIQVFKRAEGGGDTQFEFDPSWSDDNFFLMDGESYLTTPPLPVGNYSVTEIMPVGWRLDEAYCQNSRVPVRAVNTPGGTVVDPSDIPVEDGDKWYCFFTNIYDPTGSITITKYTDPAGGTGFPFTLAPVTHPFVTKWGGKGGGKGQFSNPGGVAVDGAGNVYVADTFNHRIQKFDSAGNFLLAWGWDVVIGGGTGFEVCGPLDTCKAGSSGNGVGQFYDPAGVAVDGSGNVYVAEYSNHRIQKFDSAGNWLATWGGPGSGDGQFILPVDLAVDGSGYVYVVDYGNNRIQKLDSAGNFLLAWGWDVVDGGGTGFEVCGTLDTCQAGSSGNGGGQFNGPMGVAVDGSGNVYVAEYGNHRIQKFNSSGAYVTKWGNNGAGNGQFSNPGGVAVDGAGNVYVADTGNNRIQKFDSNGASQTQWGSEGYGNNQFYFPNGVAVDGTDHVYVSDGHNRIRKFGPAVVTLDDGQSHTFPSLPPGTYTVEEVAPLPTGWTQQSATCDNTTTTPVETESPAAITVDTGDAWVCTFTNVYTPPPDNVCPVGTGSSQWTDIIGAGMGNPKTHKVSVKVNIPNYTQVTSLYAQMVAKDMGKVKFVRFVMPGAGNYVQVNPITSPLDHAFGNFWYGADLVSKLPTESVTGQWFLQASGTKGHIPRALVLYPTYSDPGNDYMSIWNTYDAADTEVYWNVAQGWTQKQVIVEPITPPQVTTNMTVEVALVDNDKDARPVWVTVEAGGVSLTQKPKNPNKDDQLNLMTFTLKNVPAGTDEITITLYSPSKALDRVEGDSVMMVGMTANYVCAPFP